MLTVPEFRATYDDPQIVGISDQKVQAKLDKYSFLYGFCEDLGDDINNLMQGLYTAGNLLVDDDNIKYQNNIETTSTTYSKAQIDALLSSKENSFTKGTAFNKNFGTNSGDVGEGNDSRFSDERNPLAHTHTTSEVSDFNASDFATSNQGDLADSALQNLSSSSINDLSDVNIVTPIDDQNLTLNSGVWENQDPAPSGGGGAQALIYRHHIVSGNEAYRGWAAEGSLESEPKWLIVRLDKINGIWTKSHPNGSLDSDKIWENILLYTYS